MIEGTLQRSYGTVFNRDAAAYDLHRPTYPQELIDRACVFAGLAPGDEVLEIGCGTGQLTRSLLARDLRITAVEPGDRLVALARKNLADTDDIHFINARLEDASIPHERFSAVFCGSAIQWVDPDVSWRRAADALVPGGTLALVQYFGFDDPATAGDQQAVLGSISRIAPEIAASWPTYRDLEATLAGATERRGNISEVWAWLGGYDVARAEVGALFDEARIDAVPVLREHAAKELTALLGTISAWSRLSFSQQCAIRRENQALQERIDRPIRSSMLACLVSSRKRASDA
jgi:SAM-dependent methyltransferase